MNIVLQNTQEALRIARRVSAIVPKELKEKLKGRNCFLCGGVFVSLLTGEPVRDFDFFFASKEEYDKAYDSIFRAGTPAPSSLETFNSLNFVSGNSKVQFIKKLFLPSVIETLAVFDFRACMCGMTMAQILGQEVEYGFYAEENALFDIAKKLLVVMSNHRNPHNVVFRIAKYVRRGWDIKGQSFVRLILQQLIRAQNIKTLAEVKDEIMGMDTLILAEFFKKYDKFPPEQPIAELELKEMMSDIDEYFERWSQNMDVGAQTGD